LLNETIFILVSFFGGNKMNIYYSILNIHLFLYILYLIYFDLINYIRFNNYNLNIFQFYILLSFELSFFITKINNNYYLIEKV